MGSYKVNQKDIFFILKEQLKYGALCNLDRYHNLNEKTLDMFVNEAIHFAKGVVDPLQSIGEEQGVSFEKGEVKVPSEFAKAFKQCGENGWIGVDIHEECGGGDFPRLMNIVKNDIMYAACQAFIMASGLTRGAAHLIESFATRDLKESYVRKMLNGVWSGTMCLTEPDAGSNLADIKTTAFREGDHFKIKGTKIFISWGDHDMTENIIHLVLARIEGAPEGVKGISLFVVPKKKINKEGGVEGGNDVVCGGIEEKLGIHASPTCTLHFGTRDACDGYLCGKENMGLAHMFQMMNAARINTGVAGLGSASAAYLNAVDYAKNRIQGRDVARRKEGSVPIIDHPDVRRMLLWMKASVEGMRSMAYSAMYWEDLANELPDGEEKSHYRNLTEFMTPIVKSYCSDTGFKVCETAMQCYGGYGFCKEYPQEQYLRDVKILSLYEGTNGIQAMDLMGRKMKMKEGAPFQALKKEMRSFCERHMEDPGLGDKVRVLNGVMNQVFESAEELKKMSSKDPLQWASYTYPALNAFCEIIMVWRLLDIAIIAYETSLKKGKKYNYYRGKVMQATYYTDVTLPHTLATIQSCLRTGREIIEIPDSVL